MEAFVKRDTEKSSAGTGMDNRCWYVYILRCADDTLYTGSTNDLQRRLAAHNEGRGAKYTKHRAPCTMVYHEEAADRSAALKREAAIKKLTRAEKLALIAGAEKVVPPAQND